MSESMRDYRRAMALHCLSRMTKPVTAGDLLEDMGCTAQGELHPEACWRGANFDARTTAGILRTLEKEGVVRKVGGAQNMGYGREEPLWEVATKGHRHPLPAPPEKDAADTGAARAPRSDLPLKDLTQAQLVSRAQGLEAQVRELREKIRIQGVMLDAKEDFLLAHERYEAELDALRDKWRARFEREGLMGP